MSVAAKRDIGSWVEFKSAFAPVSGLDSETDNIEVNGLVIDRLALSDRAQSAVVAIPYSYVLTSGKTLTLISNLQDCATTVSASFADFDDIDGTTGQSVVVTATTVAATQTGNAVLKYRISLGTAKRYIRTQHKATLSHVTTNSTTNNVDLAGVIGFAGLDTLPAS